MHGDLGDLGDLELNIKLSNQALLYVGMAAMAAMVLGSCSDLSRFKVM